MTVKLVSGLGSLRRRVELRALQCAFSAGCERPGFRLVHFSIQTNHLHLLVEADGRGNLSRGMQGLLVRSARALNRLWRRAGRVFADRYHDHVLRTPRQVRNALAYVLCNARKHGAWLSPRHPDLYSSGRWFDGWQGRITSRIEPTERGPIARAQTWLLNVGWLRHGRLGLTETPGAA